MHISLLSLSVPASVLFAFLQPISWGWPLQQIINLIKTAASLSISELLKWWIMIFLGFCWCACDLLILEQCSFQGRDLFTLMTDHGIGLGLTLTLNICPWMWTIKPETLPSSIIHFVLLTAVDPESIPGTSDVRREYAQSITWQHAHTYLHLGQWFLIFLSWHCVLFINWCWQQENNWG